MHEDKNLKQQLMELEEQFWKAEADYYQQNLATRVIFVFPPPAGVLDRARAIAGIAAGARWLEVDMSDVHLLRLQPTAALLVYTARAHRGSDDSRYSALVSSMYVQEGGAWKLAFHQHTLAS